MNRSAPIFAIVMFGVVITGLNPAHALVAEDTFVVNATTGDDVIIVEDAGGGATTITVNGLASTISNPPELLTINGLAGNDSITVLSLAGELSGSGFGASFVVDGGPDTDSVTISGDVLIADDDESTDEFFRLVETETVDVGTSILAGSEIRLDGAVNVIGASTTLTAGLVTINGLLDGSDAANLEIIGNLSLTGNVGSVAPFNSLSVFGQTNASQGVNLIRIRGDQSFDGPLQLAMNVTIVSADAAGDLRNGRLRFDGINATGQDVDIRTQSLIQFFGGSPQISRPYNVGVLRVDASNFRLSANVLLRLDSAEDSEINAPTFIGASARIRIEQLGSGDILFLDTLGIVSGSPHRIVFQNLEGDVEFNGDVSAGQLTIEDGGSEGQVRINASRIQTARAGANNGQMLINTAITLLTNTTLASIGGELQINGDIDSADFFTSFETTDTQSALNGQITGGFSKVGSGDLRITSSGNRVNGINTVAEGRLLVNGEFLSALDPQPNAAKGENPDIAFEVGSDGVLGGNGQLDVLVTVLGTVAPGHEIGILTIAAAEFLGGTLAIEINDFGVGTGFDQLVVTESVSLSDTQLEIQGSFLAKGLGLEFIIVDNRSNTPVSGTFIDMPEGAFIDEDQTLRITYFGGDGNDIAIIDDRPSSQVVFVDGFEGFDDD